jgi:hypothetical protein
VTSLTQSHTPASKGGKRFKTTRGAFQRASGAAAVQKLMEGAEQVCREHVSKLAFLADAIHGEEEDEEEKQLVGRFGNSSMGLV